MYTPTPEVIARAFDLGRPLSELVLIRRGDTDTWRLDTTDDSYLIKGYRSSTDGQFTAGELPDQLRAAMDFERSALEAGVDMPDPIPPVDSDFGWVTRIHERHFRAFRWIEHRELRDDDHIADWLGRTMAAIHQLEPLAQPGLPDWWRAPVHTRATWEEWFAEAARRHRSWPDLGRNALPYILDISARIEAVSDIAPDCVTTHGDFKTHNMIVAPTGPVLVDWDSVRTDSAALEAGRVAYIFGAAEGEPMRRILSAYATAGGDITWAGRDLLLSVTRHDLQTLFAQILVSLEQIPAARWMDDGERIEQSIGALLRALPERVGKLDRLAAKMTGI